MKPAQFRSIRRALGLSVEGARTMLGVASERTVRRWEYGERAIPGPVARLMLLLDHNRIQPDELSDITRELDAGP